MDFMKALTYPFDDENWVTKVLIGCAVFFGLTLASILVIPSIILVILIQGYSYEIMKRVRTNHPEPLPAWDNFGGFFGQGSKIFFGGFIVGLPAIVIILPAMGFFLLPLLAVPLGEDGAGLGAALGGIGVVAFWGCLCIALLYGIVAQINNYGALLRFIDREEIGTYFQFGENIKILTENLGPVGLSILYLFGAGLIASVLSSTGIGGLVATFFQTYFSGHILGQLRKEIDGASGGGGMKTVDAPAV